MKFISSFLIGLCLFVAYVSLVFAAAGDPVTPLPFIQGNHVLYEDINYGTTKRVIHLDRIYSEFENGWGSPTVSRFTVTAVPTFGALYNTVDGISVTTLLNVGDVVSHPQAIVIYVPPTTTVDASSEIRFTLSTTDNSRAPENCILVVNLFSQCPNIPDLSGNFNGNIVAPPIPQADISWDAQNTKFKFSVNGAYLRDMAVYLIDYSSFNPITDSLRATTNCASRPAVPTFTRFDQIWDSAPHALFQDALSGYYAAYAHTAKWVPSTTSCSQVTYSASFGFTEFVHCNVRGSNTNSIQVTTSSVNNTITYAGSLQVNVLQPIDPLVETLGYSEFNHFFPFRFTFRSRVHAVVGVTSEKQLRVYVRISELDDQGNLHLVLETHYPGTGLTDPTVQSPLYYVSVNPSSCPAGTVNCIQSWTYSKNLWTNDDNGPYFFDWAVIADPTHRVSVTVTLKHEVNQVREFDNLEIGKLLLRVFNNNLDMENGQNSKGLTYAFRATERVWVRGDLGVPEEDQANFLISYVNVWLCWSSIEGYQIDYIEGVKQGCLDPFILASEKYQLILNGLPNPDASVAPFNPQFPYNLVSGWANPIGPSTGFSFSALPLARNNRIYTIHAEVNIVQKSTSKVVKRNLIFKRDSEEENTGIAAFQVSEDSSSSSSSSSGLSFWYFVVPGISIGVLLLVGLVVVGVVARRRYKRVEQDTTSHQVPSEDNKEFVL